MPTASIIIPTYNRGTRLERAIESVLSQRFEDFELIVVDDASTDGTETVVKGFDDPRVRYLAHGTNRGGSAARNTGIDASEGEFIAFLDDDDEWLPHKLGRQIDCLENRSDEWVAAYCDYRVDRHGKYRTLRNLATSVLPVGLSESRPRFEGGAELVPATLSMKLTLGGASTLVVRRDVLDQMDGFDENFQYHQDWEFLVRLLHVGKLSYVDELLVVKHESSEPSAATLKAAKRTLFTEFSSEIREAEREGYDVTGVHRFALAKRYYMEGQFVKGTWHLFGAKINPVGLLRALCVGMHSKVSAHRLEAHLDGNSIPSRTENRSLLE